MVPVLYVSGGGAFSVVCANAEIAANVLSQIKLDVRPMYSNPPLHGAQIVATVFGDPALYKEWYAFLKLTCVINLFVGFLS